MTTVNSAQPRLGEAVELTPSSSVGLSGGGYFDPDGTRPIFRPLLVGPGGVRGTVEDGAGAAVVLVSIGPETSFGQLVVCKPDGTFEATRLVPGAYYVAAFHGLDFEGLRDPEVLRRTLAAETKVQVASDSFVELQLKTAQWPE
jgi:hypothetical protein